MNDLQIYITIVSSVINLTLVGFVAKLALMIKSVHKEKEELLKIKIDKIKDDLALTEKWAERNQKDLKKEMQALQERLNEIIKSSKIDFRYSDVTCAADQISEISYNSFAPNGFAS